MFYDINTVLQMADVIGITPEGKTELDRSIRRRGIQSFCLGPDYFSIGFVNSARLTWHEGKLSVKGVQVRN
jgi:hypothetical protein